MDANHYHCLSHFLPDGSNAVFQVDKLPRKLAYSDTLIIMDMEE